MTTAPTPFVSQIAHKLHALRRSVRLWIFISAAARMLAWALVLLSVDLVIDFSFQMDLTQRTICLVLIGVTLAVVCYRRLLRPLATELTDDALVMMVEARNRKLGDSLISAYQFAQLENAERKQGVSQQMINATIEQGSKTAKQVDFRSVLNHQILKRNLLVLLCLMGMTSAAGAAVVLTEDGQIWFERNILLGDAQWPRETWFDVEGVVDGVLTVPRGHSWRLVVTVRGVLPAEAELDYRPQSGGSVTLEMKNQGRGFYLDFKNALEPFEFRVSGGDGRTPWIQVHLVPRPSVEQLSLVLTPPAYIGTDPQTVWDYQARRIDTSSDSEGAGQPIFGTTGIVYALKGSSLQITGRASKGLSEATLELGNKTKRQLKLADDQQSFSITLGPDELHKGTYRIEMTDTTAMALNSRQPFAFSVRAKVDREPRAEAKLRGIGSMVTTNARIPMDIILKDDFSITDAKLAYEWLGSVAVSEDPDAADEQEPPGDKGEIEFRRIRDQFGKEKRIEFNHVLELEALKLPADSDLTLHLKVTDNDTVSGPKSGQSRMFAFRVVSEGELRQELLRREQELRQDLEGLIRRQEKWLADAQAIAADVRQKDTIPRDLRYKLFNEVMRPQREARRTCLHLADRFVQLKDEMENNRLEAINGPITSRMNEKIIRPLRKVADRMIPRATALLEEVRKFSSKPKERDEVLQLAIAEQQEIAAELREVLKHVVKLEAYGEAIKLAQDVLKAQKNVNEATRRALRKRLQQIFNDDQKDPPKKNP